MSYDFTFETQGINTYMVYQIKNEDKIDSLTLGMLTNNKIPGIASVVFTQEENKKFIKYNISSKVTVEQFFIGSISKKRLIGVFSSITSALIEAEEYMIERSEFLLDLSYMFVDVSSCEAVLVCLPIGQVVEEINLSRFFKNIMFSIQFDQTENCDYVAKIINYLNRTPDFELLEFKKILDEIKAESKSLEPFTAMQTQGLTSALSVSSSSVVVQPRNVNVQKSITGIETPDKKSEKQDLLKERKGWFSFGNRKKKDNLEEEKQQVRTIMPKQRINYGETTLLGTEPIQEKEATGNLIRMKTQEKIVVDKEIFRIGKEKSFVDYYISDNKAISRSHARLVKRNREYFIVDTNSTNHTYINGKIIPSNQEFLVPNGATIRLGNEEFKFELMD
ncbi:DUF6382 domain-containing protein [Anaerosacchariphilus polymeriproducens]|uniref:FHA domain-containing protein n=1 Tax=Anaerosacchariphilus polymeriproducens TaxID=1812858 RepID=A0A371ATA8_9FIRM|nr:DUF6382 domain-containing protein [Anaerosacchariphilus polymeriproducens]RDU22817.1 FHA domain-containing protein [Anaerosacchariphilus polymeriproducens]